MELNRFREITAGFTHKNVLVVGDLMLDTYLWGDISQIYQNSKIHIWRVNRWK